MQLINRLAVVAICNLILFVAFPGHTYYTTPALIMPKLYANTILAVLNGRFQILGGRATYVSSSDFNFAITNASFPGLRPETGSGTRDDRSKFKSSNSAVIAIHKEALSDQERGYEMKDIIMHYSQSLIQNTPSGFGYTVLVD
ncbi:hypothetical protein B0H16DRAFT_1482177 [Mycena metata]|uniref:DUF6534 domain-containing protein n=1 Tax=Mycena metata TaxID=1033252 RepID=A0AAD7M8Q8_9AGAR|nr:hypothetical protein B0H16DRAFT_1482177 [Mycena metata]